MFWNRPMQMESSGICFENTRYSYLWSTGANTDNISLLFPGTYTVDIMDANGCMITDTVVINPALILYLM